MSGNFDTIQGSFASKLIMCFRGDFFAFQVVATKIPEAIFPLKNHVILTWMFREMVLENLVLLQNSIL